MRDIRNPLNTMKRNSIMNLAKRLDPLALSDSLCLLKSNRFLDDI